MVQESHFVSDARSHLHEKTQTLDIPCLTWQTMSVVLVVAVLTKVPAAQELTFVQAAALTEVEYSSPYRQGCLLNPLQYLRRRVVTYTSAYHFAFTALAVSRGSNLNKNKASDLTVSRSFTRREVWLVRVLSFSTRLVSEEENGYQESNILGEMTKQPFSHLANSVRRRSAVLLLVGTGVTLRDRITLASDRVVESISATGRTHVITAMTKVTQSSCRALASHTHLVAVAGVTRNWSLLQAVTSSQS